MTLPVTAFVAAICAIILLITAIDTVRHRIRLKRGMTVAAAPTYQSAAAPPPVAAAEPARPAKAYHEIKSPMVGTYYSKPAPDKPDYVQTGSRVAPDTVICKLEAMKIFNDLTAECAGTVVEVCVKNGQPVDFGTVLFRVDAAREPACFSESW